MANENQSKQIAHIMRESVPADTAPVDIMRAAAIIIAEIVSCSKQQYQTANAAKSYLMRCIALETDVRI